MIVVTSGTSAHATNESQSIMEKFLITASANTSLYIQRIQQGERACQKHLLIKNNPEITRYLFSNSHSLHIPIVVA